MKAVVSEKGQVTIPKRLRERLGIRAGEVLEFAEEDGRLVAEKADVRDALGALFGSLALDARADALLDELRGPAELPPSGAPSVRSRS